MRIIWSGYLFWRRCVVRVSMFYFVDYLVLGHQLVRTGIVSRDCWRYEAVAEWHIRPVNLKRCRKTEIGTQILCHRDKTSRSDKSTLDNKHVALRFCGDATLQKAHDIMCAKSCIDIVKKRHLAKRQIHKVTGECEKDTCKMHTLISVH